MTKQVWDKVHVWNRALRLLAEEVDFGTLTMLQDNAYLDSLEDGNALVGCKSWAWLETFERKRLGGKLENALAEVCQISISLRFVHGRPRIIEKPLPAMYSTLKPMDDSEVASLHAQYGDIISIVDNHPVFVMAQTPINKGGWGIFKKILTRHCKDYGVQAVLDGLRDVASKPNVGRPRAYFLKELERGRWGHKLVITPSITGPQLQPV